MPNDQAEARELCERRFERQVMQLLGGYWLHLINSPIPRGCVEIAFAKGITNIIQLVRIVDAEVGGPMGIVLNQRYFYLSNILVCMGKQIDGYAGNPDQTG